MTDDMRARGAVERTRISLAQDWEVDYWTDAFGVSEEKLRKAVADVGPQADAVRAYLGNARRMKRHDKPE